MNRLALILVAAAAVLAAASSSLFVVQRGQVGAVYAMGKIERVEGQPGLYFKWPSPLENVMLLDQRVLSLRSAQPDTFATRGKDNVVVSWFVKWRVADARQFLRSFGDSETSADDRLGTAMRAGLSSILGTMDLRAALAAQGSELPRRLRAQVGAALRASGIEVVDAGLTQLDYSADATEATYRRMAAARNLVADQTRAQGQAAADKIRAQADRQRQVLLAQAYRKAQTLKGEGDAEAAQIYARAFGKDPEFAAFYRSLEAYRASFDKRSDVMVLDPSNAFFRYLRSPDGKAPGADVHKR